MRSTLLLLLVLLPFLFSYQSALDENQLAFSVVDQKPIVYGQLNGKPAAFLLDTGSDLSLLCAKQAASYGFHLIKDASHQIKVIGIDNHVTSMPIAVGVEVVVGALDVETRFVSTDFSRLGKAMPKDHKVPVVGILGSDVMRKYGFSIDFEQHQLSFEMPSMDDHAPFVRED